MKTTVRFSDDDSSLSRAAARVVIGLRILMAAAVLLVWVGCSRSDTRVRDPELTRLVEELPASPSEVQGVDLCEALPSKPGGFIVIQEIAEDRSVTLAFRFEQDKIADGAVRYGVVSLQVRISPKQIPWHMRLEEEMEHWVATVTPEKNPGVGDPQESILHLGRDSSGLAKEQSGLKIFEDAVATALGSLHLLKGWCESKQRASNASSRRLHLDLPGKPSLVLQVQNARSAQIVSGDKGWKLASIAGGVQAVMSVRDPTNAQKTSGAVHPQRILQILSVGEEYAGH